MTFTREGWIAEAMRLMPGLKDAEYSQMWTRYLELKAEQKSQGEPCLKPHRQSLEIHQS